MIKRVLRYKDGRAIQKDVCDGDILSGTYYTSEIGPVDFTEIRRRFECVEHVFDVHTDQVVSAIYKEVSVEAAQPWTPDDAARGVRRWESVSE